MADQENQLVADLAACRVRQVEQGQFGRLVEPSPLLSRCIPQDDKGQQQHRNAEDQVRDDVRREGRLDDSDADTDGHQDEDGAGEDQRAGVDPQPMGSPRLGEIGFAFVGCRHVIAHEGTSVAEAVSTTCDSWRSIYPPAEHAPVEALVEVGVGPRADDSGCPMCLAAGGEQVIGALERDEAAGVAGQAEDLAGALDADRIVGR